MTMPALACNVPPPPPPPSPLTYSSAAWGEKLSDAAQPAENSWSPAHSSLLYRVEGWGAPYFAVNPNGNVSVLPHGIHTSPHQEIDLLKVVKMASDPKASAGLGLALPLVIRFPDVLKNRLESLQMAFDAAIESHSYNSRYRGVYPIKCNQDRFVVEDIVRFGKNFGFGLEAGSKPELLLAMSSLCNGSPEALLVCNGFKDVEYISLSLIARKLQLNSVIVLEQEEEVDIVIEVSKKLGVRPTIGVRAKLRTKHSGHFGSTSGEKGKFGLTPTQILRVVKKLIQHDMLDCLQLLHFHIGSQIPSTSLLTDGIGEAAQIYCELVRLGAGMSILDVGGGLGLDYDGTKSQDSDISVSYTVQEYAAAVVKAVKYVCDRNGVDHPVICSESGRAIVSHHSVLVFEAFSSSYHSSPNAADDDGFIMMMPSLGIQSLVEALSEDALSEYRSLSSAVIRGDYDSCLAHAERLKQRCVEQFKDGSLCMEHLAAADGLYELILKSVGVYDSVSTYHVNLSIFTSIPDFWAIGQLFPIIPIHRLDEKPSVRAVLSDLTCDSDGKIDRFIDGGSSLPVHELQGSCGGNFSSAPYYIGMFLGGAYQEALGGLHNLFGGASVVRVAQTDGPQGFSVTRAVPGPSCGDVLRVMGHEPELMFEALKHRVGKFVVADEVSIVDGLARSFGNMPYLLGPGPCGLMAGSYSCGDDDNACCYCSDECYASSSSGDSVVTDDDQWSYFAA